MTSIGRGRSAKNLPGGGLGEGEPERGARAIGQGERDVVPAAAPQVQVKPGLVRRVVGVQSGDGRHDLPILVDHDIQYWMWVARVLERSDEYMRRRPCRCCKATNSKKLLWNYFP